MQATIQRNESIIQMLKMQLAQFQQQAEEEVGSHDNTIDNVHVLISDASCVTCDFVIFQKN